MILCDTDVIVDILRKHPPALAWAQTVANEELVVPGYVAMQLVHGYRTKHDIQAVLNTLGPFRLASPNASLCDDAFQTLLQLRVSYGVDLVDALIAHTAIGLATPLYTFNLKHFAQSPV